MLLTPSLHLLRLIVCKSSKLTMIAWRRTAVVIVFIACPSNVSWIAEAGEIIDFINTTTFMEKKADGQSSIVRCHRENNHNRSSMIVWVTTREGKHCAGIEDLKIFIFSYEICIILLVTWVLHLPSYYRIPPLITIIMSEINRKLQWLHKFTNFLRS